MAHIIIKLSSDNLGPDADETFFEVWSEFVARRIGSLLEGHTFDVSEHRFDEGPSEDTIAIRGPGHDADESDVREALRALWDEFCNLGYTLRDLFRDAPGSIIRTDRGNGCAGPVLIGTEDDLEDDALDEELTKVTEEQDPDAWHLAREALAVARTGSGTGAPGGREPTIVAIGKRGEGDNGHQTIYVG